jgi:hypothetical protein
VSPEDLESTSLVAKCASHGPKPSLEELGGSTEVLVEASHDLGVAEDDLKGASDEV